MEFIVTLKRPMIVGRVNGKLYQSEWLVTDKRDGGRLLGFYGFNNDDELKKYTLEKPISLYLQWSEIVGSVEHTNFSAVD